MRDVSTIELLNARLNGTEEALVADELRQKELLLLEASAAKELYRSRLKRGTWIVEFNKVDGSPSIMECTLDARYLPPEETQETGTKAADNPTVLRVYALDRQGWRSFKVLNVTKFYQKPEEL